MEKLITLNAQNISDEHICCAISDKKCREGYELKKDWLRSEFENGYIFRRIDARAKVFMEYGPAETAWLPIDAPEYLNINCFWVSGKYKGNGYAKELLKDALNDCRQQDKNGLVTVVGKKKFHFMSDGKWLLGQGFEIVDELASGFNLLAFKTKAGAPNPKFRDSAVNPLLPKTKGLLAYYSNRCPFTEFHVNQSLKETTDKRGLSLKVIKLSNMEAAQKAPCPATIFSLFFNGKFITTDISVCIDSRFDKIMKKLGYYKNDLIYPYK